MGPRSEQPNARRPYSPLPVDGRRFHPPAFDPSCHSPVSIAVTESAERGHCQRSHGGRVAKPASTPTGAVFLSYPRTMLWRHSGHVRRFGQPFRMSRVSTARLH